MKKIGTMVVVLILMALAFTGCSIKRDRVHATVTLTISDGKADVWRSVNGAGLNRTGKDLALQNKTEIVLNEGETANITFNCEACGCKQEYNINEAWADVLSCDCPEKIDQNGNAKEYTAISISFKPKE